MTLIMSSRYYYKLIKNLHFKQLKLKHDPKKKKKNLRASCTMSQYILTSSDCRYHRIFEVIYSSYPLGGVCNMNVL